MAADDCIPPAFVALAAAMPPLIRSLIVDNADPSGLREDDVLRSLGLEPAEVSRMPSYPGLRSLELLRLLPKSSFSRCDVQRVPQALSADACAALRRAVDAARFGAADSVDGALDYQLNLELPALEELIGVEAVRRLWAMAADALASRPDDGPPPCSSTPQEEAHEIFIRRYTPTTRPWFPFHKDRSALTVNVALSSDAAHGGGRLLGIFQGRVHRLEREEGCATVHPSTMMHAVSRMTHGARYALIVFFGRNRELMRFNAQVQEALRTGHAQ